MKGWGYAISMMSEEIINRPHSEQVSAYLARKYSKHGFKKERSISYNPEFRPEYVSKYSRASYRWMENVSDGLRKVGNADDIIRLDHNGWYTDNFQNETVHGEVYQLPARNGEAQYVPAVNDPNNDDCACLDFGGITSDKEEAARDADHMAEHWAESEREYQAKEDQRIRLEDIASEIKTLYADYRKMIREIRASRIVLDVPVVRDLIRKEWRSVKLQIHKLRREANRIEENGIDYN